MPGIPGCPGKPLCPCSPCDPGAPGKPLAPLRPIGPAGPGGPSLVWQCSHLLCWLCWVLRSSEGISAANQRITSAIRQGKWIQNDNYLRSYLDIQTSKWQLVHNICSCTVGIHCPTFFPWILPPKFWALNHYKEPIAGDLKKYWSALLWSK